MLLVRRSLTQILKNLLRAGALACCLIPSMVEARLLQIIHTNDIHALYETAGSNKGGLAQLKYVIDQLRARAEAAGIDTLVTDGGDFTDGSIYRFSEAGAGPLRLLDSMGYDAAVIGNHDWLVGANQLNTYFDQIRPRTPFVTANFNIKPEHAALKQHFTPYIQLNKAGAKIAVLGLTTNEWLYDWLVVAGKMTSATKAAREWIPQLKRENDFVFVLSHLGFKKDRKIAARISEVDLMIGAHSHTELQKPRIVTNLDGKQVPIVQTGANGQFVGDLLVDLEPGLPLEVIHSKLVEVKTDGPQDQKISSLLQELRAELDQKFGFGWLSEVLGDSPVPMEPPKKNRTVWGDIYAEALRDAAGTELSLDFSMFFGPEQAAGPVTREKLFNYYPRTYSTQQPHGWTVWKVKVPGWLLKLVISATVEFGGFPNTAGLTYNVKQVGKLKILTKFRINGKRINPVKNYDVAISEGVGRGTDEISKFLRSFFLPKDTGVPIWEAVEYRLRKTNPERALSSLP
ncbi:MAG TPA: hypothetical protein DCS07_15715 [Bdellovibrionales bacterium]|nr:MAG: hypothetical protein A2Z97_09130 [Bdellovibrionales bacterium GWB1_52_6]OFZ05403.1 MAG: hypothetical protein A2X97_11010 [Bdellovibrionales bacterium GWA1_52_35]OFZ32810.1 MAG: hypothetical protein A2070_10895 [Bdellovibrionales bacterium GWC1_52_8]HAR44056.1 hypothetical protein [Bdellovibrionales bacterium]HCM41680.1 hypothetical protein [Bdellovibrionales bacterium]